ncbi:MAG: hypothetical protein RJQ14_03725 [Marinoscillum sp.]
MKKLIYTLSALMLFGCESGTKEFLDDLNEGPQINFVSSNSENTVLLEDSIKTLLDIKADPSFYEISLSISDENDNLESVIYSQISGLGTLLQGEDTIRNSNITLNNDVLEFEYYPRNYGAHIFTLTAQDEFGESNQVRVQLVAFENLLPQAILGVNRLGRLSPFEYAFDASESFDKDQRFGGGIIEYEFFILDKQYRILTPEFKFIFPTDGVYDVGLRVKDNNGKWSTRVTTSVTVEG